MITKLLMTRVEPCFCGNKQPNGEVSRVKKDASMQDKTSSSLKSEGVDTFTSSKDENLKEKNNDVNVKHLSSKK